MLTLFEPDEAVPYPYVLDMIKPASTVKEALINFAFYDYYFYGYPVFGLSALLLLPVKWWGFLDQIPINMLILRQMISVLPMLFSIGLLVYWRTGFKDYRSILLLLLLLLTPAVVQNNFWWHPDSLAIFFAIMVLFFLSKDNLHFKKNFYLAAVFCGFSAGTKSIGFYFFFTILLILILGFVKQKMSIQQVFLHGIGFIIVMGAAYLFANPILIYQSIRTRFFDVMQQQSQFLMKGYEVEYEKGLKAVLPHLKEYYGGMILVFTILGINILGFFREKIKFDQILILSWALPLTVLVFFISHFKYQYWLPVFLPLASTIGIFLPKKKEISSFFKKINKNPRVVSGLKIALLGFVILQIVSFIVADGQRYYDRLFRTENNPAIQFYGISTEVLRDYVDEPIHVYHDVRMYVPETGQWKTESAFEMLTYSFIQTRGFDVLLLLQSRIDDYTNSDLVAIDQTQLEAAQVFYWDADKEALSGYQLLYRNDFGLIYSKEGLAHP